MSWPFLQSVGFALGLAPAPMTGETPRAAAPEAASEAFHLDVTLGLPATGASTQGTRFLGLGLGAHRGWLYADADADTGGDARHTGVFGLLGLDAGVITGATEGGGWRGIFTLGYARAGEAHDGDSGGVILHDLVRARAFASYAWDFGLDLRVGLVAAMSVRDTSPDLDATDLRAEENGNRTVGLDLRVGYQF